MPYQSHNNRSLQADCFSTSLLTERLMFQALTKPKIMFGIILTVLTLCAPTALAAETGGGPHLDGKDLNLLYVAPFVGMLLSIAVLPLTLPHFWHDHFGKISIFWALTFFVPFTIFFGFELAIFELLHVLLLEYFPFIIFLFALFTISGGIRLKGRLVGTPILNTGILLIGTILASFMGTTGAAMLLIRPLCRAIDHRKHKVHTIVFFIFLVANIGGSLTPMGDPPLLMGFLKGVSFLWPTQNMLLPMLLVSVILLAVYYGLDRYFHTREDAIEPMDNIETGQEGERLGVEGLVNLPLLFAVPAVMLLGVQFEKVLGEFLVYHVHVKGAFLLRDLSLLGIAGLSLWLTKNDSRQANGFTWFPIIEVALLFLGIFMTIVPAIAILKAGSEGALAFVINTVTLANGEPNNVAYFWITGVLSGFLDNAPTYLVFFNAAGGDPDALMTTYRKTLLAISAGAVFMGALTYIGNAPNFMVRAIVEDRGIKMPSFFGYMAWSVCILIPVFVLVTFVFFVLGFG